MKLKNNKIVRFLLSFLLAVFLWSYVINVVNPSSTTTLRNIPVTLSGTEALAEKNLAIVGSGEYTVDITVRASRSDLSSLSPDNFRATADVSGLTLGQDYITVAVEAPHGYTVDDIRSRKIQVYVDELATVTVPVIVNYGAADAGYEAAILNVYPEKVKISGAKQLIGSVDSYRVNVDTKNLKFEEPVNLSVKGSIMDAGGNALQGLVSSAEEISVKAAVYKTKTVSLQAVYSGDVWEGAKVKSINAPTGITIKGPSEKLAEISSVKSKNISIEGIFEDFEEMLEISLPEGVFVSDKDSGIKLSVDLEDEGSISFRYSASDIKTLSLANSLSVVYSLKTDSHITAEITGPVSVLKTLASSDVQITVDGSGFAEGTRDVKITASTQVDGINIRLSHSTVGAVIRKR